MFIRGFFAVFLLVLSAACDADTRQDVTTDVCTLGNALAVVASAEMNEEAAAEIHVADHLHTVTLEANTEGYVWFEMSKAGPASIYVGTQGELEGFYHEGNAEEVGTSAAYAPCADTFPISYEVTSMEAGHWHMKLKATDASTTFTIVVLSSASEDSHDDHDHNGH